MNAMNLRRAAGLVLGALALCAGVATEVRAQAPAVDPAATQILRRMTDYLGGLQRFSVDTQNTLEEVLDAEQKIQYDISASVAIQRPNKLRAERKGDIVNQLVLYDGKTLTIFNPQANYYAVAAAPDTIEDTLRFARESLAIVPPVGDLLYRNAFELLTAGLTSGMVVGKSVIGGVKCDHLAFRGPMVDWQIWIADGDRPLPCKYLITTRNDPAQPQYMVLMSNWNVAPKLDESSFRFSPPQGAKQTEFLRLDTGSTSQR